MKIMTFNTQHCLNFIEGKIDYRIMADAIKSVNPDIVGLNEICNKRPIEGQNDGYDKQTAILSELTGMKHQYFAKAKDFKIAGPYGNALLSKLPIVSSETIPVPDPVIKTGNEDYETRCLLKVKLEGGITVLVTHFGLNPDEQENAVDTVLKNIAEEKCILMGDFNVLPEDDILKPIRERMKDTAECFGKPLLSFPSDKPEIKIDYIFVSRDVEVVSADIPEIIASDHRPHTAIINISGI